jgi:hypothetical protein
MCHVWASLWRLCCNGPPGRAGVPPGTRGGRGTLGGPERLGSVGFGSPIATRQRGIPDGLDPGLRPFLGKVGSPRAGSSPICYLFGNELRSVGVGYSVR